MVLIKTWALNHSNADNIKVLYVGFFYIYIYIYISFQDYIKMFRFVFRAVFLNHNHGCAALFKILYNTATVH